jgi:hypothetical protein
MARAVTLPLIGTLALTGIGVGIQLGYSAIAEIDPIYYSQPETRFHADLSPYRPSTATPPATLAARTFRRLARVASAAGTIRKNISHPRGVDRPLFERLRAGSGVECGSKARRRRSTKKRPLFAAT